MNIIPHSSEVKPPVAEKIDHITEIHGHKVVDPYFWLREKNNSKVIRHLEAENAYFEMKMEHTKEFQKKIYDELLSRIQQTDLTVPYPEKEYFYYTRTEEGKQYSIYCRKKGSLDAPEEVILDQNILAEGYDYSNLGVTQVSHDHNFLAYSHDIKGDEYYTLYVKNLNTGQILSEEIPNTYYSLEWASDSRTFYYTTLDHANRPYKVLQHRLGEPFEKDQLIYHEEDEKFYICLSTTNDDKYILLETQSQVTSEVHYLLASDPSGIFQIFIPRQHLVEYSLYHQTDRFLIVTNHNDAKNFKLMEVLDTQFVPGTMENWTERIPHRPTVRLDALTPFENFLVIWEREDGIKTMRVQNIGTGEIVKVPFPDPVYVVYPETNKNYKTTKVRFTYTSLLTPKSIFDYNMEDHSRKLLKEEPVLGHYDPLLFESKRLYAVAPDGVLVPLSVVYRKGLKLDGENPCYLYGYGSYGHVIEPSFSSNRLTFLERGFIFVIAHIRGGGTMGRPWYDDGKLLKKKNTFTDFVAAAEHLIKEKYTNPSKLVIEGRSAGGLLIGAVLNMAPHLFKAAVLGVPFVDVVNTMLDASLPLTVIEYEEWGNPNEKEYYDYMISYSPYDNMAAKDYPNILVITAFNDPRLMYWEPTKYVAKLRSLKTDNNVLLFKCYMEEGHGGASGRYDHIKQLSLSYVFLLDILGFKE